MGDGIGREIVGRDLVQCMVVELELSSSIVLLWLNNLWDRRICALLFSLLFSFLYFYVFSGFGMCWIVY